GTRPKRTRAPRPMPEPAEADAPRALSHVFTPVAIGGLSLPHRIVMGSMHLGLEGLPDAGERLGAFYRERALGGAGLIVTRGWAVSADGAADGSYGILGGEEADRGRAEWGTASIRAVDDTKRALAAVAGA